MSAALRMTVKPITFDAEAIRRELTDKLATQVEESWRRTAASTLRSTAAAYLDSLTIKRRGHRVVCVLACGKRKFCLPVALELGMAPFDMKPGLLGRRAHAATGPGNAGVRFRRVQMPDGTFRTVSTNSQAASWKHPGLRARKIHEQVLEDVRTRIAPELVAEFVRRVGKRP